MDTAAGIFTNDWLKGLAVPSQCATGVSGEEMEPDVHLQPEMRIEMAVQAAERNPGSFEEHEGVSEGESYLPFPNLTSLSPFPFANEDVKENNPYLRMSQILHPLKTIGSDFPLLVIEVMSDDSTTFTDAKSKTTKVFEKIRKLWAVYSTEA